MPLPAQRSPLATADLPDSHKVSGANFNPAVTTCLALTKKLEMSWVAPYMASQIAGGLAAAFLYYLVVGAAFH